MLNHNQMNFESQFVHCDYDYDYKVWPEVYLLLINLLICLLTANYQLCKVLNNVLNHKMMKNDFDFYLEDITESSLNTDRIKELKAIKNNQSFHVRQNSTQLFFPADYDSDPDSVNEPDFDCYPDSENEEKS